MRGFFHTVESLPTELGRDRLAFWSYTRRLGLPLSSKNFLNTLKEQQGVNRVVPPGLFSSRLAIFLQG